VYISGLKKKTKKCCAGAASLNGGSSSFDGGLDGLVGPCYSPCYSADIEGLESGDDGLLVDNSSTCSSSTQAAPCSSAAGKLDRWSLALHPSKTLPNKTNGEHPNLFGL
jgi:hypothetical protein